MSGSHVVVDVFAAALEITSIPERMKYLDDACQSDAQLRQRVEELLSAHDEVGDFLAEPHPVLQQARPACLAASLIGTSIGPYRLTRLIGDGGMGVVYEAEQSEPVRRSVALKLIKPGMDTDEVLARFEVERRAIALMDHPSITRIIDAGASDGGRPYFAMELVDGLPITEYCDLHCCRIRQRLKLFVQVCRALQHAHQKGIIHRDLKPTNILVVEQEGRPLPKIIDFGLAKALQPSEVGLHSVHTQAHQLIGTPLYMSPEQTDRTRMDADTRSDVYSLGVLLYELLVGTTPFDRDQLQRASQDEVRRIVQSVPPPRPSQRLSTLHGSLSTVCSARKCDSRHLTSVLRGELDWIVLKALEKDRSRRYESVSDFAADVERFLNHEPVQACPPSRLYVARKLVRQHRAAIITALLIAVSLVSGFAVAIWQAVRATQSQAAARAAELEVRRMLYAADVSLAADAWENNDSARMRNVLERQLPQPGQPDFRGFEWYYLWQQSGARAAPLIEGKKPLYSGTFSPDARWLAVTGADAVIHLFDGRTLAAAGTIVTRQVEVNGLAFSPDSRMLASTGDDGTVAIWDPHTRTQRIAFHAHDAIVYQAAFTPDGRLLATCADEPLIRLWDAETGEPRGILERHSDVVEGLAIGPQGVLAAAGDDGAVSLWDTTTRECLWFDQGPEGAEVASVAISPEGRLLADARRNAVVTIRDLSDIDQVFARRQLTSTASALAFSPDGQWLAAGDDSGDITLIPLRQETAIPPTSSHAEAALHRTSWHAHDARIYGLAFSADGQQLVSVAKDGRATAWSLEPRTTWTTLDVNAREIAFDIDDHLLTAGAGILRSDGSASQFQPLPGTEGENWARVVMPRHAGTLYARAGFEKAIYSWEQDGTRRCVWRGSGTSYSGPFVVNATGSRLVITDRQDDSYLLQLFDPRENRLVATFPFVSLVSLDFSPDGSLFAFSRSTEVLIVEAEAGTIRHVLPAHQSGSAGVAFSPDGAFLATVGGDRTLSVWNVATGRREWSVFAHALGATDVAFTPDGQTIATVGKDGMLRLWRWGVERLLLEVPLPADDPSQLEFSPSGDRLACRHRSGQISLIDISAAKSDPAATSH